MIGTWWDTFPSQTDAWESALTRAEEDGCICSPADCCGMRKWFNMFFWLEGRSPTLEVGYKSCVRCRSLLKSRYKDIAAKCTVTLRVSLLDAFSDYCNEGPSIWFTRCLSPTTKLLVDRMLEPLMKQHGPDMRYLPPINRYPECLRPQVAKQLFGGSTLNSWPTVELPDSILDGAHDLWVVLGAIFALVIGGEYNSNTVDRDLHDDNWHGDFSSFLRHCSECFDMPPLPRLSSTSIRLCHELTQEYAEQRRFRRFHSEDDSDWVYSGRDHRQLPPSTAVMAAVATFLRNKDVDLYGCPRCDAVCMEFFTGISSAAGFEAANSGDRKGLGPPLAHIHGEGNALGRVLSSASQKPLDVGMQEPVGMEAFTTCLRDPTLSIDEVQLRMVAGFHKLRQHLQSRGLDASDCFHRSDGGSLNLPRHVLDHGISSSKLSKSDKVERIKDKLLE
ncbi:hypothetical protein EDD15DRAFT_2523872, partial [Pisolithus albus]